MNKPLNSLDQHRKRAPLHKSKVIQSPAFETGLINYPETKEGDNSFINIYSPQKKPSKPGKTYKTLPSKERSKKKKPYVHTNSEEDQKRHGLKNVSNFPVSLSPEKLRNDDDDDDDEFRIIDVNNIKPSPLKNKRKLDLSKIDGLLELSDDEDDRTKRAKRKSSTKSTTSAEPMNLMSAFEEAKYGSKSDILKKYKSRRIPPPIKKRSELLKRAKTHFHVIKLLLQGKEEPSVYYEMAKKCQRKSPHETMTAKEQAKVDWEQFYGGYYGFQRQSIIGKEINNVCKDDLQKSRRNPTISYWSIPSFATHVLANEVIIRMIMEDLKLDYEAAEAFCQESTDYGIVIADKVDMEDDV
ncbi:RTC4 [Candida metapsilosis]|uniref:Restriction of telomere capping protein 4 n=1 Tax=Candida metapsilosis TaxID=273372 RepID=A0A8H7ZEL4_9ASCO|nr:RTC4 [Candida metapsilosis]